MAQRKEVFQSKVLKKLYPAPSTLKKEDDPPRIVEALAKKTHVKRQASAEDTVCGDAGKTKDAANPGRRMYTVLPPPADYSIHSEESVTLTQLESINSAEDPAEERSHEGSEELDGEKEEQKKRRRRKRKQVAGKDGAAPVGESSTGRTQVDQGEERISKNKKRKLKKKRHKEKLLSMGLMPRAAALEFTYQKDGEAEAEDIEIKAAEVSDFLRKTMEIYTSDSLLHVAKDPHLSATVDDLLGSIATGCKSTSVLNQLHRLKAFVQQNETVELEKALKELNNNPSMSAEETTAVASLFQYWITDILPMQGDKTTRLSTTHP
ncbi:glutamate-rich protein 1 [Acanthochromis polyacanthus]|uniref:glutamate-rich protein 1 n=1 Tax=Acanthochromis polyacanthus TaxID=80966 RepID=UPI002234678B|nr:glutamate-rich protein 1 [Acanthochromis polyacanthus]